MNIVLVLSLCTPAAISVIQIFLGREKVLWRIILSVLTIATLYFVFSVTKDDAKENEEMRKTIKKIDSLALLSQAKIDSQSQLINNGFSGLYTKISNAGITDSSILTTVKNLEVQVGQISTDSKNYFSQVVAPSKDPLPNPVKQAENVPNATEFKIPVNQQNTLPYDSKNNFTISKYFEKEKILFLKINGHDVRFGLGAEYKIIDAEGKKITMVYKGIEGENHVFLLKIN